MEESEDLTGPLFDYADDLAHDMPNPSLLQRARQKFDPRNLGAEIMIQFQKLSNSEIDMKEIQKDYNLNYNKIVCFRYTDLKLQPFFFIIQQGRTLMVKGSTKYHTMIESDLQTVLNIIDDNISVAYARKENKLKVRGGRVAHDEMLFMEIFQKVAPKIRGKLRSRIKKGRTR